MTTAIKERVESAFRTINGKENAGLLKLARDHPAIFYGLVAKCIPNAVALTVDHHGLDLGLAIRQGRERLNIIDVTPDKVVETIVKQPIVIVEPDKPPLVTIAPDSVPGKTFKRLRRQKKKAGGGAGVPPKA
jgi:hypothetical protein